MEDRAALDIIAERLESVRTAAGTAVITLTGADGRSVRLDGAMACEPGSSLRLRAWKFNAAVFDLTVRGKDVWLMQSDRARERGMTDVPAAGIVEATGLMWAAFYRSAEPVRGAERHLLTVSGPGPGGQAAQCTIDRTTLTPHIFRVGEATLVLDRYRVVDGVVWPMRWRLTGEHGRVELRLGDVELNRPLPEAAFTPPRRAARLEP
jgi:hypothetical protein